MLKFFRRSKDSAKSELNQKIEVDNTPEILTNTDTGTNTGTDHSQKNIFSKLYSGLEKTRKQLFGGLSSLFTGKVAIDDHLWEELENHLILADVGIDLTQEILSELTKEIEFQNSQDISNLKTVLKAKLSAILKLANKDNEAEFGFDFKTDNTGPRVLLVVGVNGAGKTTTIGKLASKFKNRGHSVMLAAGDTFRAAAIEQLNTWGERINVPVIAQQTGADSASVIFDAYQSAKAKRIDILIADTAGRLHTQAHLMQELAKIKRVLEKNDPTSPHEIMLVLDASQGQNALQQAKQFLEVVKVTSIAVTKLDGTAKGGIIFAIARQLNIPIRYIGVGEGVEDLQRFDSESFVEALIGS